MQIQKDNIRERIIAVAREEFVKNGVKNTSMQRIALLSGIAVGNIYNYFQSKDHLFRAIVQPALDAFNTYRKNANQSVYISLNIFKYEWYFESMKELVKSFVLPYRNELKLLLNDAAGTSLKHAIDHIIEQQGNDGMAYIQRMKQLYPFINDSISPHIIRSLCSLWKDVIKEIATHDDMNRQEQDALISDYVKFDIGGWKYLLGLENTTWDEDEIEEATRRNKHF